LYELPHVQKLAGLWDVSPRFRAPGSPERREPRRTSYRGGVVGPGNVHQAPRLMALTGFPGSTSDANQGTVLCKLQVHPGSRGRLRRVGPSISKGGPSADCTVQTEESHRGRELTLAAGSPRHMPSRCHLVPIAHLSVTTKTYKPLRDERMIQRPKPPEGALTNQSGPRRPIRPLQWPAVF